jgi:hypothetical protein
MKTLILSAVLLSSSVCLAQISGYSVHIGPNIPFIPAKTKTSTITSAIPNPSGPPTIYENVLTLRESYDSYAGLNFGGSIDYTVSHHIFLSSGLSVNFLKFREKNSFNALLTTFEPNPDYPNSGQPYQGGQQLQYVINANTDGELGKTSAWFVQIPVLLGTRLFKNKFILQGGATVSFTGKVQQHRVEVNYDGVFIPLHAVTYIASFDSYYNPNILIGYSESNQNITKEYSSVLVGAYFSAGYQFANRLKAEFSVQPNFTPTYDKEHRKGETRITTFSIGLSYSFKKSSAL